MLPTLTTLSFVGLLIAIVTISILKQKLTVAAAIAAAFIASLIFAATAVKGASILFSFFVLSVFATRHKKDHKAMWTTSAAHTEKRDSKQVLANGGIAGILALFILFVPAHNVLLQVMLAASLASALADTLSSELGMVYGRRFYHVLTFKQGRKGLDGMVSIEGTLIGVAGATLIALLYAGLHHTALYICLAGVVGNFTDSVLGATLERKGLVGNNVVNFLNTFAAALAGALLYGLFN